MAGGGGWTWDVTPGSAADGKGGSGDTRTLLTSHVSEVNGLSVGVEQLDDGVVVVLHPTADGRHLALHHRHVLRHQVLTHDWTGGEGGETRTHTGATISDKRRSSSSSEDGGGGFLAADSVWEVPSPNDHVMAGCHGSKWCGTRAKANWKKWNSVWIWRLGSQSVGWGP